MQRMIAQAHPAPKSPRQFPGGGTLTLSGKLRGSPVIGYALVLPKDAPPTCAKLVEQGG